MKKIAVALAIAAVAVASVSFADQRAGTGINGSMHDMNWAGGYTGDSIGRSCVFCHTPHNSISAGVDAAVPLWNHAVTTLSLMTPYTWVAPANLAGADALNATNFAFASDPLTGPSRLCMACHDGSTAPDSHGANGLSQKNDIQGTTGMSSSYTDALGNTATRFITDLNVTHPIGFSYADAATVRGPKELVPMTGEFITADVSGAVFDTHNRTANTVPGKKISEVMYNGMMTCASCHDVHNTNNAVPTGTHDYNYFLWAKEEGSAICLSCHIK